MASEVGVLDIPPENVRCKERLHPGKVFLVDTVARPHRRRRGDQERARRGAALPALAGRAPDRHPRPAGRAAPARCPITRPCCAGSAPSATPRKTCACCSRRWRQAGEEAIGSMGTDTAAGGAVGQAAAAVRLLQAAVRAGHQPAARRDPRGADHVDGLDHRPGGQPARSAARSRAARSRSSTRSSATRKWPSCAASATTTTPRRSSRRVRRRRRSAASRRAPCRCCSIRRRTGPASRRRSPSCAPRPSAARRGRRQHPDPVRSRRRRRPTPPSRACWRRPACTTTWSARARARKCALVVEAGDAREVHHCALLIGYGAGAVNPYLAFETFDDMIRQGMLPGLTHAEGRRQLRQGAQQGHPQGDVQDGHLDPPELLRRADLRGHRPEARRSSTSTSPGRRRASRASASRWSRRKCAAAHEPGLPDARRSRRRRSSRGGEYQWRRDGEYHLFNPQTGVQAAARDAQRAVRDLQGVHEGRSTTRAASWRRCAA